MDVADFEAVLRVHLFGSFHVARAAAPHFRKQENGTFVHMTSTSGLIGNFGQANYAAAKMGIVGLSKSIALDMARFNVRSNCIAPFAWSRLIGTIPTASAEEEARVERVKSMTPDKIAPVAVFLASALSAPITGQVLGVRKNEVFLFSQPRPIRSLHHDGGWTPGSLAELLKPALTSSLVPLERSGDVFSWDPI
jgi:NAD(P)-dependent dehydrogenase (short-subunit alcohol dehydrogenase family)